MALHVLSIIITTYHLLTFSSCRLSCALRDSPPSSSSFFDWSRAPFQRSILRLEALNSRCACWDGTERDGGTGRDGMAWVGGRDGMAWVGGRDGMVWVGGRDGFASEGRKKQKQQQQQRTARKTTNASVSDKGVNNCCGRS